MNADFRKSTKKPGFRIYIEYSLSNTSVVAEDFIKNRIVPAVIRYFSSLIHVRYPTKNPFLIHPFCSSPLSEGYCGEWVTSCAGLIDVPSRLLAPYETYNSTSGQLEITAGGRGLNNVDFALFITSQNSSSCVNSNSGTIAHASHCFQEPTYDRPIAGNVNFCPLFLATDPSDFGSMVAVLVHEIVHTIVFSPALFPYFRNPQGEPLVKRGETFLANHSLPPVGPLNAVIMTESKSLETEVIKIVTPKVISTLRDHFNCPELTGAELQSVGGGGQTQCHWQERIFHTEIMTPILYRFPVLSKLTLALLEDSGWYVPNYENAGFLQFGFRKGCDFATQSCNNPDSNFGGTYCHRGQQSGCTFDWKSKGQCSPCVADNLYSLPCLASNCTTVQNDLVCALPYKAASRLGEQFGYSSRCFSDLGSKWIRNGNEESTNGGACYMYSCSLERQIPTLQVKIGKAWINCVNGSISLAGIQGFTEGILECPPAMDFCPFVGCQNDCHAQGNCYNGQCYCWPGFHGEDCGKISCETDVECPGSTCDATAQLCNRTYAEQKVEGNNSPAWFLRDALVLGLRIPVWCLMASGTILAVVSIAFCWRRVYG